MSITTHQLASYIDVVKIIGREKIINKIATLKNATEDCISFFSNSIYKNDFTMTRAGACIVNNDAVIHAPPDITLLVSDNPYYSYAKTTHVLSSQESYQESISNNAYIAKSATIGKNTTVLPGVFIGENVKIGDNCIISSNVFIGDNVTIGDQTSIGASSSLMYTIVGSQCTIHPGVRIGQDGFGFAVSNKNILKIKHFGKVIIENEVEIGANTTIDRGALDNTIIGKSTKIDNLVQIGHNVVIGEGCFIAGMTGIAGSTKVGNHVMIGGKSGISGHLTIGDYAKVLGGSGVIRNVEIQETVAGYPACEVMQWHRMTVFLQNIINKNKYD
jgi:UDP-3-O-[3-hydroxymyristoyl] glucosamine N-acyltransferase